MTSYLCLISNVHLQSMSVKFMPLDSRAATDRHMNQATQHRRFIKKAIKQICKHGSSTS